MDKKVLLKFTKLDSGEPLLVNFYDIVVMIDKETYTLLKLGPPEYEGKVFLVEESFEDVRKMLEEGE